MMRFTFVNALCLVLVANSVAADCYPQPGLVGDQVVVVQGKVNLCNQQTAVVFDLQALDAMPQGTIYTHTPWTPAATAYTGPSLRGLLQMLGAEGRNIRLVALNDYMIDVPWGDIAQYDLVLATRADGNVMRVRDMGPIWLMYPFDTYPKLQKENMLQRAIWQVSTIIVH